MKLTVLIPTYNEAQDIRPTLDAACALDFDSFEVLVVDDASKDNTCAVVRAYEPKGVRLLALEQNGGVARARNIGLRQARGEVTVILNADVQLPKAFAKKIWQYYEKGADYVLVEAHVSNYDKVFPRYVQTMHHYQYSDHPEVIEWTEGYSCRTQAALAVGGFPEVFPGASGEDAIFGDEMKARFKRVWAPEIVVEHIAPDTLDGYWKQRVGRGRGSAYRVFGHEKQPLSDLRMAKTWLGTALLIGTIVPMLWHSAKLVKYSKYGWADWLPLAWAHTLDIAGWQVGFWQGFQELKSSRK
ncbi:MAG TPA: glycosyltransferase family 2 protein [Anaerolineales bacterium]|nr:glycosyltransferase family 2 protein [Anaerolineales bacterium]